MRGGRITYPEYAPLHRAALNGHEAACRVLIEAGAKVDAGDSVSWHCMGLDAV